MKEQTEILSVLIVSSNEKAIPQLKTLFDVRYYYPINSVGNSGEAKRILLSTPYDIVVINTPLSDEFGIEFARDIAEDENCGVLLIVKNDVFDEALYKVRGNGILCISRPISIQLITQAIGLLTAVGYKTKRLRKKNETLKNRMEEIRLINRAKCILIEQLRISEEQAHRYIEKQAMDMCIKRTEVAKSILKTYENK